MMNFREFFNYAVFIGLALSLLLISSLYGQEKRLEETVSVLSCRVTLAENTMLRSQSFEDDMYENFRDVSEKIDYLSYAVKNIKHKKA